MGVTGIINKYGITQAKFVECIAVIASFISEIESGFFIGNYNGYRSRRNVESGLRTGKFLLYFEHTNITLGLIVVEYFLQFQGHHRLVRSQGMA